ncbi:MAG: Fic family protein [Euryarchaeota archaeon]|nr:Fic family protein [Euryarchaeota archaeon]
MVYHVEKIIRGKKYHYLIKNIRIDGKWKKFSFYIGKGEFSKAQIETLKKDYSKIIEKKVNRYLRSVDPLFTLLTEKQIKELENIRSIYVKTLRKIPAAAKRKYYEWFLSTFTYDTNAIEGSTLTLRETSMILFDKITPPGKTLREIYEVENHKKAFDYILNYKGNINKKFVCLIHKLLTHNILGKDSGVFRKVKVFIPGAEVIPPKPENVENEFKQLMDWYNKNKKKYHPIVVSSYIHTAFEGIHPFIDFNGRVGRLLLNFILLKNRFPAIDIKNKEKARYYDALQRALKGNLKPFVNLVIKYIKETKLIS